MNVVWTTLRAWCGLAGVAATVLAAPAATNAPPRLQPARWLLVVDTSAGMERRAQAMEGVINDLLSSAMNGQMRPGDELGIWTYNKELSSGVAPRQIWDPAKSNLISEHSAQFIGGQKYQDKPRLENVVPVLNRVVKESRKLTILLFSDGSQKFTGTPHDDAINSAYVTARPDLAKSRMPLVTVLRSERGNYIGYSVSAAPWPVEYPPFRIETDPASPPVPKPAEPMKSIIIGTPKQPLPTTNTLVIPSQPGAAEVRPVVEIKPVSVTPVEPAPTIEAEPPKPVAVPGPEAAQPVSKPVELVDRVLAPRPSAVEATPVAAPAVALTPAPVAAPEPSSGWVFSPQKWLLILGIGCMWVAVCSAFILARRSRKSNAASLITRSFDRNHR